MIKLLLTSSLLMVSACSELNKQAGLKDDNPIEDAVEFVIEKETGAKIDLTPDSQETPEK